MSTVELFLIAMLIIYAVPYLAWRLGRTESIAPLVVVQIFAGILLGPGMLGAAFPEYHKLVFSPRVVDALNGLAWWSVSLFVWMAGIELDVYEAWKRRRDSIVTAGFALGTPLAVGCLAAIALFVWQPEWMGDKGMPWQFVVGVGMGCAVTALPILVLLLEKLDIFRHALGQRALRYASLDDIAIWGVLALILMEWERIGRQGLFILSFLGIAKLFRYMFPRLPAGDRWYAGLIWLIVCSFAADWAGLHFMVGAFLAGVALDASWFDRKHMDMLRHHVLLVLMPVFFLSTGLRTTWTLGAESVFIATVLLLVASIGGKLLGVSLAGRLLRWPKGESSTIGWLLQTKGLIEIVFANVLLDKGIISSGMFTALLLMAVVSTALSIPMVAPHLARLRSKEEATAAELPSSPVGGDASVTPASDAEPATVGNYR